MAPRQFQVPPRPHRLRCRFCSLVPDMQPQRPGDGARSHVSFVWASMFAPGSSGTGEDGSPAAGEGDDSARSPGSGVLEICIQTEEPAAGPGGSRSSRPRERYYNNPDIKRIYLLFGLGTLNALLACLSPCPPSKHCYSRCPRSLSLTYLSTRLTGKHWAAPYASSLLA
jgi:hypothetical protein